MSVRPADGLGATSVVRTGEHVHGKDGSLYAYDAALGTRLRTWTLPSNVTGGATIVGDMLFVPYGSLGPGGGVQAWKLR